MYNTKNHELRINQFHFPLCSHTHNFELSLFGSPSLRICARCAGLYGGALLSTLAIGLSNILLGFAVELLLVDFLLICLLLTLPLTLDWWTQSLGWRESNNRLRITTGLCAGLAGGLLLTEQNNFWFGLIVAGPWVIIVLSLGNWWRRKKYERLATDDLSSFSGQEGQEQIKDLSHSSSRSILSFQSLLSITLLLALSIHYLSTITQQVTWVGKIGVLLGLHWFAPLFLFILFIIVLELVSQIMDPQLAKFWSRGLNDLVQVGSVGLLLMLTTPYLVDSQISEKLKIIIMILIILILLIILLNTLGSGCSGPDPDLDLRCGDGCGDSCGNSCSTSCSSR